MLTLANTIRVSASFQEKSPEMLICSNSADMHFIFLPQGRKAKKSTNVKSPPEKLGCWWLEKRRAVEFKFYKPGNVLFLLGKGISSYVILMKGYFIGKNQYSKL